MNQNSIVCEGFNLSITEVTKNFTSSLVQKICRCQDIQVKSSCEVTSLAYLRSVKLVSYYEQVGILVTMHNEKADLFYKCLLLTSFLLSQRSTT
jgi:hypothetical protein